MSTAAQSLFGRAYRLSVQAQLPNGQVETIVISDSAWEPEALRFTFEIEKIALRTYWNAVIRIYNCDGPIPGSGGASLANAVISEGMTAKIEAGYYGNNGALQQFGTIWEGQIFQPIWTRENVTDYVLTLYCIHGQLWGSQDFINASTSVPLANARAEAEFIFQSSTIPIPYTPQLMTALDRLQTKATRGQVYFGSPSDPIDDIMTDAQMQNFISEKGYNGGSLTEDIGPVVASYAPAFAPDSTPQTPPAGVSLTLIGVPRQTLIGADFTVLLDPRMNVTVPFSQATLDLAALQQMQLPFPASGGPGGQVSFPRPIPGNGTYLIIGVRHTGDNRGNDWLTHVTGVTSITQVLQIMGGGTLNPNSDQ